MCLAVPYALRPAKDDQRIKSVTIFCTLCTDNFQLSPSCLSFFIILYTFVLFYYNIVTVSVAAIIIIVDASTNS